MGVERLHEALASAETQHTLTYIEMVVIKAADGRNA